MNTNTHLQWAKRQIRELRTAAKQQHPPVNFEGTIKLLRWHLKEDSRSLKSIGTSEAELEQLFRKYHRNQAAYWFKRRILNDHAIGTGMGYIRNHLRKACAKPEDIGTTEADLVAMEFNYWLNAARAQLDELRLVSWRVSHPKEYAKQLLNHLHFCRKAAKLTLEQLGTNEKDLRRLCRV